MAINAGVIRAGLLAGFMATVVLTILMMAKNAMGVMPGLDPVHMLSDMLSQNLGLPEMPALGWLMHFGIGTVAWGGLFAVLYDQIPGSTPAVKGIMLGMGAWLMMMIGPLPMSGAGLFGMQIGIGAPIMTFVFHIIFGLVLGIVFARARPS